VGIIAVHPLAGSDEHIPIQLVLAEKLVWDLVDPGSLPSLYSRLPTASQPDIPFERAFENPTLVSRRYPVCLFSSSDYFESQKNKWSFFFPMKLMFTRMDCPLTPELYIDGWRRHFTYFVDWTRQLEPFQRMSYADRVG
jgi:hypothetical protein